MNTCFCSERHKAKSFPVIVSRLDQLGGGAHSVSLTDVLSKSAREHFPKEYCSAVVRLHKAYSLALVIIFPYVKGSYTRQLISESLSSINLIQSPFQININERYSFVRRNDVVKSNGPDISLYGSHGPGPQLPDPSPF
jgi:hypothetical protein